MDTESLKETQRNADLTCARAVLAKLTDCLDEFQIAKNTTRNII